ncbi:MAG: protein kinase [Polyangiaceae bacterium]|jgi:serine/threonine protein kinase/tetratricopeptide (TPR) repeat protein
MNASSFPPKQIADFEILARLGVGGMAEVFLAKRGGAEGTFKVLVLKRILPTHESSPRLRSMFVEEAHLATRLNHPNVVQVYELEDCGDEGLLLAMEHVDGCDLGRLMAAARERGARLPPWVGAWIIAETAKGLHYAHEKRDEIGQPLEIVHRDVSPHNVLLSFDGAVKIADFGIASARLFVDEAGVLKGKFGYMSPEQARGEAIDRRTDVYGLGVVLWEILTGMPLHGGLGGEALLDIVRSGIVEPPSTYVSDVPRQLEEATMQALAPERTDRFPTAREMSATLGRAIVKHGELIDATTLEGTIAQFVPQPHRDPSVPGARASEPAPSAVRADDALTLAAAPHAKSAGDSRSASRPDAARPELESQSRRKVWSSGTPANEGPREVRHVAIVTLTLRGLEVPGLARRTLDQLRSMLDDLAFKRGMRWMWLDDTSARAVAGLTANPSRCAGDAAQLALDVHEAVLGFKEDLSTAVTAAIAIVRGIATGTRDARGHLVRYKLADPAAYLANALAQATPAGRTWAAGGFYRLLRREFRWSDAPIVSLDPSERPDVPSTLRVHALERSLSREERLAEVQARSSDLVGRDVPRAELRAAFDEAISGGGGIGRLVCRVVVGEMGIGKTALVAAFLNDLPTDIQLLHVECTPVTMEVPYAGIAELIRAAIGTSGDEPFEQVASLISRAGGGTASRDLSSPMVMRLAELATNRQIRDEDADAHSRKKTIVAGLRNLLGALALARPLLVLVEGLHWGDKPSLDALSDIVTAGAPLPVFVVLVTRPEERVRHTIAGLPRVELHGLAPDEQVRLVEVRLGVHDGASEVCQALLPKVGGNPFFLLELVDALLERGALEIRDVGGAGPGDRISTLVRTDRADAGFRALPSTLEQLLGDRLRDLPPSEHAVVNWLAIAGGPLAAADLRELTGELDDEPIVRLCAQGLCDRKGDMVDVRHPLARDAAYRELLPRLRATMHRTLGEHLAGSSLGRGLSAAIVARHFVRGESYARAADFYIEAADGARKTHQTTLAIRYYQKALSYMRSDDERRVHGHEALESAYRTLGRRRERRANLQALRRIVRQMGTPRAVCLGLLRSARYDFDDGRLAKGVLLAKRAAEIAHMANVSPFEVEAEGLVSDFLRELGDVQGALAACDRALIALDAATPPIVASALRGEILRSRGILLRRVGRVREAVDAHVDAIAIFRACAARRAEARVKNSLAYSMFVQGRYEDAIALALESIRIDLSIGGRFQVAKTLTTIGHTYFRLGDVRRALAYVKRAREAHDRYGDQDGWAETLLVSSLMATELGHLGEAEAHLRDAAAIVRATGNAYDQAYAHVARATLARAERRPGEAVEYAITARRDAESMALVAIHFYAMATEAAARVDLGEMHTAMFLATTALGAVENLQGCEYGLEVRVLCADALTRAGSPQAPSAAQRAIDYAYALMDTVRDDRLRTLFPRRPLNAALFGAAPSGRTVP